MELFAVFFNGVALLLYPIVFLLIVLILAFLFKKIRVLLLVISILLVYFFANGVLTEPVIKSLEANYSSMVDEQTILDHQAMIVLGGGITRLNDSYAPSMLAYSRILQADKIYHIAKMHGIEYTIFISGGGASRVENSEANVYKDVLIKLGVPPKNIILEDQSMNTFQNSRNMSHILEGYPFKSYLLVTSGFHMKRASIYFNHFNIHTVPAISDFTKARVGLIPYAYNLGVLELAMHEYIGIARLWVYDRLGIDS